MKTLRVQVDMGWPKIVIVMGPLLARFCGKFVGLAVTIAHAFAAIRIESAGRRFPTLVDHAT
jgi:hypothetical protein